MKYRQILSLSMLAGASMMSVPTMALTLPATGYVQYGDAQSYSLPLLSYFYDQAYGGGVGPGNPFYVNSTPGAIKDLVVVATGASGGPVNTNFAGMDNAYPTPTGVAGSNFFSTPTVADPGPSFTGDRANTWDATVTSLKTFLGGESLIFFFNNNQINSGGQATQSLAAWAQITLTNPSGAIIGTYDFTNKTSTGAAGGQYLPITEGGGGAFNGLVSNYTSSGAGPNAGTNASTDYVLSGGALCLTNFGALKSCGGGTLSLGESIIKQFDHNLGANQAPYALTFPELDAQLAGLTGDLTGYVLHVDLRMGCDPTSSNGGGNYDVCTGAGWGYGRDLNNGYEQLFIGTASTVVNVPEPATMALLGVGLLGLGLARRRLTA